MARSKEGETGSWWSCACGLGSTVSQVGVGSFGQELVMGTLWWPPRRLSEDAISSGHIYHCSC